MWTLEYHGTTHPFSEYGIVNVRRTWKNLMTECVLFDIAGRAMTDDPVFAGGDSVKIFRNGVKWFEGIITQIPVYGSPKEESHKYEASGVWWYLENLIYQQEWKVPMDAQDPDSQLGSIFKGHIILGQDINGQKITIGEQICDIIEYTRSCGANFNLGAINVDVHIPFDECKDLSCADAIRRLLRWVPDTVCYADYSTAVPTLFFKRRSQLSSATIDLFGEIERFSLQPRYDLLVPSVVLKFETINNTNGKTWKTVDVQKYPTAATGTEFKALVLTINLEGIRASYVTQKVTTSTIDSSSLQWWKKHIPWLNNFSEADISIGNVSRISSLGNEIESGVIADWMSAVIEEDVVQAKISYKNNDVSVVDREVAVKINATDISTGTYKKLMSLLTAEMIPENLAQNIFEAVGTLQYDGYVVSVDREVGGTFSQFLLNFSGGRAEWNSMNAVVQEVVQHLDTGRTHIKFGPAKHLGAADLTELTRSGRLLFESRNYFERGTAEAIGNGVIDQGIYCRVENTSSGECKYNMLKFVDPSNPGSSVKIDVGDLPQSLSVFFREEDVCESGVLKKRYSLASEPFINHEDN